MATTRLLRSSRSLPHVHPPGSSSSSATTLKCIAKNTSGLAGDHKMVSRDDDKRKSTPPSVKASVAICDSLIVTEPRTDEVIDLASLLATVGNGLFKVLKPAVKRMPWKLRVQTLIEKAVMDCRFFTLFATLGALLSSILCYVEGCFLILEAYSNYFSTLSHSSHQGHIVQLLVEGIDMFLVGTAMLTFGVGLYVIFVGSKNLKENEELLPGSNLFGLFYLKSLPTWVQMESVSQAKSRIGQAVMMILQVGLLEKFKKIPMVTSLDLACFAGAVLVSSACIYIFSKLFVAGEGR